MVDLARDFQSQMAFLDDWPDQRATTRAWEDFLTYKDAERSQISGVRREIVESWSRCLDSGIDAHSKLAPLDTNHDLEEARRRNAELLSAAEGPFAKIGPLLTESGALMMLTDAAGLVLDQVGDMRTREAASSVHLVNGGHCLTTDGEVLAERPIPMEILDRMLHVGMREGFPVSMLTDEGMVASSVNDGMREFLGALGMPLDPAVADLREVAQRTPCRQMCVFMSPEQEERIMREFPECVSSRWSPLMADINMRGVTKASGMDVFLRHYGIDRSRSMAFGDGGNDVEMIRHAGVGVALGNAVDAAKRAADYVTATVDDDGVLRALQHYGVL